MLGGPLGCTVEPCLMRSDARVELNHSKIKLHILPKLLSKIDPSELAAKGVLRARRLCCLRREIAFNRPESAAGSLEARSYRSPFCTSSRRGADRRCFWS